MALSPSATNETSKLVPPMSQVMRFGNPALTPIWAPAMTPAAGPDKAVRMGKERAISTDITPPFD